MSLAIPVNADRWRFPERAEVTSAKGSARFTIIPKRDFGIAEFGPYGILERRLDGRSYRTAWVAKLVNRVTPVDAVVSDSGAFVVTLDDHYSAGIGEHTIVVYGHGGKVLHKLSLLDIMTEKEVEALPHSVSSIWWRCGEATIDEPEKYVILSVKPTRAGIQGCQYLAVGIGSGDAERLARPPATSEDESGDESPSASGPMSTSSFRETAERRERLNQQITASPPIIRAIRLGFQIEKPFAEAQANVLLEIERLLEEGADPNALDARGMSALQWASTGGMSKVALLLVRRGADPAKNGGGWEGPFSTAIANNDTALVQAILSAGAHPNQQFGTGNTPLTEAIMFESDDVLAVLLASGADPNLRSKYRSPLEEALWLRNWKAKESLVRAGAKPIGLPPSLAFSWAIEQGDVEGAAKALAKKSEFDSEEAVPEGGLARAAEMGSVKMVKFLVKSGINPDSKFGLFETTALIEASKMGHVRVVKVLLDSGLDLNAGDVYGYTPLDVAALFNRQEVAKILHAAGGEEGVGVSHLASYSESLAQPTSAQAQESGRTAASQEP
jgi:ankyrin repeat protein